MTQSLAELKRLPPPEIIKDIDFQSVLQTRKDQLNGLQPLLFDVNKKPIIREAELLEDDAGHYFKIPANDDIGLLWLELESEPSVKQLEIASYHDVLQAQRINDAVAADLLALSYGNNLDHLASFYDVQRLEDESDDAFRERIQLSIRGWSPGSLDYYEFQARSAIAGIRDVLLDEPAEDGLIRITIMSEDGDGIPTSEMLDTIRARVNQPSIKLNNDTLLVEAVTLIPITINPIIYTRRDALPGTIERISEAFPKTFNEYRGLGWDVDSSWIIGEHQQAGVKRVEMDFQSVEIQSNQCPVLASYDVINGGVE